MIFRLADMQDLQQLKVIYKKIIKHMEDNNIYIWDEVYPCDFFEEDIKNNRLYVLYDKNELVSAFALCDTNLGENSVKWNYDYDKFLYLDRFGVNINYLRKGIGSLMIDNAKKTAKNLGAKCLRLFVVDKNEPAIQLYVKNQFQKADGMYDEVIDDELVLHEYGYELLV